ncbi:MAG: hypothetical protein PWR14_796 [Thermosediminibacterales bacterium]|nr:hypothetical protein [Thermosediminibacterales bacterium]
MRNDALFSKKGKEVTLYIVYDHDPPNPRDDENLGIMVCSPRRYRLGDEQARNTDWYSSWGDWFESEVARPNGGWKNIVAYFPLYLFDHSGLAMNTAGFRHCDPYGFDWGQVGYIYTTRERVYSWFGVKRITEKVRKKVREILLAEVEEYDKYLRGEYFGFVRENNNGEIVDSLFGFTDIKDMLDYLSGEAKRMLLEFVEKSA